ncbi:MAG: ATP phosphoribosyltransferase regulatory subunit [Burkholderiales bacterium]|jgi:ATP phosphoribosyltransferase regulatory subunit|nr:ATP phosphoribosyltransferase regulatory subunit [Burkholderiales bacterium]
MSSAWLLPEHVADVLPVQARHIEELRRGLLDVARRFGFELVAPPLLEHIESLLSGTGRELDLATFKLVDQLSGRTLGVRADSTPQVARIDAHLLNRRGVTRLCYCGPVLRTLPAGVHGTREPLQFGAEIYGHAQLEADLEVLELALDCLDRAGVRCATLDLADARIVNAVLQGVTAPEQRGAVAAALAAKDVATLHELGAGLSAPVLESLLALVDLYGDESVLRKAAGMLHLHPVLDTTLRDLQWLAGQLRQTHPEVQVGFDLADLGGYGYYSGARFAIYTAGGNDALVRGGRYNEVGAIFGRNRPAVGFSLDLKALAELAPGNGARAAIRAAWAEDAGLRAAVRTLRGNGETVVCMLPGHEHEAQEFECDRELVAVGGEWLVRAV